MQLQGWETLLSDGCWGELTSAWAGTSPSSNDACHSTQAPRGLLLHCIGCFKSTKGCAKPVMGSPVRTDCWAQFWCYGLKKVWSAPGWAPHHAMCLWLPRLLGAELSVAAHMPSFNNSPSCKACLLV